MAHVPIAPKMAGQRHVAHEGDVVMVAMQLKDKQTGKPFPWRWLGIVTKTRSSTITVIRFGVPGGEEISKISKRPKDEHILSLYDELIVVRAISEDAWPDGVHAFKMQLIMRGRLNDVID